jgi:uncharacterized protein
MIRALLALVLFSAMPAFAAAQENLVIVTETGSHTFKVEVADDPDEQATGLMNRTEMARDAGMIFDFNPPREPRMWMKNTFISLDMLFIGQDGTILAIAQRTTPESLRIISPGFPVRAVLELNGGLTAELGIAPGDKVRHRIFPTQD